ncbi:MAG: aspartate aminotransferase family protein [Synechococcus sp. SB0676_bin_10]|uniref:Aspartate aminotransferase family protein n=1 Tax=Synechococcus sp. SB0676_bin_10 TaxID=2604869 RepID=A0A6B1F809_9SYNE|nr:aspartate aminotransferase family protein [Synechococcus sp. SB0676_bin_10]
MGEGAGGIMASGGTICTITALVTARHQRGLDGQQACLYASADCHNSLAKALRVMGLPAAALRLVSTDDAGRLDPHRLDQSLEKETDPILAVVATAGTTVRGAVDPIGPIADICHRRGLWLHVDGAIGAVCGLGGQRHQELVAHMGCADSLTINPQKWLGIAKASAMVLLRQPQALADTFAAPLAYMEPARGVHGGDCGLQGTRPAEVLKLWLGLRHLGQQGIDELLDGALQRAQTLRQALAPLPLAMPSGNLHIVCFRPRTAGSSEAWSRHTREQLLDQGLMLSRPRYRGQHYLKAVLGNPFTGMQQIAALVDTISASLSS